MEIKNARMNRAVRLQQAARQVRLPNRDLVHCFKKAKTSPGDPLFSDHPSGWLDFFSPLSGRSVQFEQIVSKLVQIVTQSRLLEKPEAFVLADTSVIFPGEPLYPDAFYQLTSPPLCLYARGRVSLLQERNKVSIVGTRAPSPYGERLCRRLVSEWAQWGVTVVSGLAAGIDGLSHRCALKQMGKTIGVLGCGPDRVYPAEHADLYAEMACNGLLLTEFPPGTPPMRQNFPARNRLIAALSRCLLVVEAAKRSGTMITTDIALDLGIPVLCLPGAVDAPQSKGTNALIQEGAAPLLAAADLLPYIDPDSLSTQACLPRTEQVLEGKAGAEPAVMGIEGKRPEQSEEQSVNDLAQLLAAGPLTGEELAGRMKLDGRAFLLKIGQAELTGKIVKLDGLYYLKG